MIKNLLLRAIITDETQTVDLLETNITCCAVASALC